ncbi:DUF7933 domain-containing protein [Olleya aquimaris]|uniref:Putative repeat protein (TIGR01451 family)/gliding motility-associated-like protein n=1 Tax=Olleya aquimaris TaxID=639310 RepID=A0A327RKS8_9FLAO|nr:gliding motility-associated C-terminal domain-containing protein [Olleya aquimaris]RAJ17766.1 putative repeat protein (TIGR01451 family)/gliding motility-associated-like protein [Olleya aquimaris]
MKKSLYLIFLCFSILVSHAQTTDLSIVVEAQNLSGNPISQVNIYEDYQYLVTIFNSGDAVNNATFSQTLDPNLTIENVTSLNPTGGASLVTALTISGNTINGTVANLPSNSNVQVKVIVRAPLIPGGIATTVSITEPNGIVDTNTENNISIISFNVVEFPVNFSVVYNQISPTPGNSITDWNQTITYQFTITNNTNVVFPLQGFKSQFYNNLSVLNGVPVVKLNSLQCIGATNGMTCPDVSGVLGTPVSVSSTADLFSFNSEIEFSVGGSLTFEMEVLYQEPECGTESNPLELTSLIELSFTPFFINQSSNLSNDITNPLPFGEICGFADLCISTIQINPNTSQVVDWFENVTLETTICNMGPEEAYMRFFLLNLSPIPWDITSITCDGTNGSVSCSDFTITNQGQFWESNEFFLPAGTTITITTVLNYPLPDGCSVVPENINALYASNVNLLDNLLVDPIEINDFDFDQTLLPSLPLCDDTDGDGGNGTQLSITKTQIDPVFPIGSGTNNTAAWGEITYEIIATNSGELAVNVEIIDFLSTQTLGTLVSVDCVATTGNAECYDIINANIGVLQDGIPEVGQQDVFWEITPAENFFLPADSSITYHVVIDWQPECSIASIPVQNNVKINNLSNFEEADLTDNEASSISYLAPCIDLIVQTYPEFTSVGVSETFNWYIDITNSDISTETFNIFFENTLGSQYNINGTPTCAVTNGSATCISSFSVSGNTITGVIPSMTAESTLQITIPVMAPNFGGAFTNSAEATPEPNDFYEITPETNISISNVQVIAPEIEKSFTPNQIIVGQQSILEFTVYNLAGNPAQSNISFTDNLPTGVTVSGPISWVNANGCTAIFTSTIGGTTIGVTDLTIPNGVDSCTFSVNVTSSVVGDYLNNATNFTDQNNIDSSQASATLEVLEDTSNVDIEVLKSVTPTEASIGNLVVFTVITTNAGTTEATNISILENLPIGYQFISEVTSYGTYDILTSLWSLPNLLPNQSETLHITAQVISSNNLLNVASLNSVLEVDRDDTNNEDYAEVTVDGCLQIPSGFSPGNDAVNDTFVIPCIEDYPENILKIYNRNGTLVYLSNNYINDWNGIPNQGPINQSKVLPVGTYYYVLTINSIKQPFVGYVYLNY